MREIKFRAWDPYQEEFQYSGSGRQDLFFFFDLFMGMAGGVLMQYTGLKDKNGKEIYEGDIFQDEESGEYDYVEWDDTFHGWTTHKWYLPAEFMNLVDMEVVGNIYENPELLETIIK